MPVSLPRRSVRGRLGFDKFENGILDLTPTGNEIAITEQNAQRSPLLRLLTEIRDIIWRYALGHRVVRLGSSRYAYRDGIGPHLSLLRVCRQVYSETALLPHTLNTFAFCGLSDLQLYAQRRRLFKVQNLSLEAYQPVLDSMGPCHLNLPLVDLPQLRKIDITLLKGWWENHMGETEVRDMLRAHLQGIDVQFH
ncbi:hypothetical protein CC86DRAFT_8545 [Ophiobolus disseminans]|uniref:Uncharacterized protein n=1 Tax=Ophiobolus disseminans TaxID=1469910 RepID=A0A6A7AJE0_9PLEO|nr:hypothetical protein CC86DRAFT_8545 [Ophiobolus disseminans]